MAQQLYRLITGFNAAKPNQRGGASIFRQLSFRSPEGLDAAREWTLEQWHEALDVLGTLDEKGAEHEFLKGERSTTTATGKTDEVITQLVAGQNQMVDLLGSIVGALPKAQQQKVAAAVAAKTKPEPTPEPQTDVTE